MHHEKLTVTHGPSQVLLSLCGIDQKETGEEKAEGRGEGGREERDLENSGEKQFRE